MVSHFRKVNFLAGSRIRETEPRRKGGTVTSEERTPTRCHHRARAGRGTGDDDPR